MIYQSHKLISRLTLVLVAALVIFGASVTARAKDTWTSVQTRNFRLIGNASDKDIRVVGNRLEQFRAVFGLLFPTMKLTSPVPTTVIVFKSDGAYKPYKVNANVAGYFQPGDDVNYITLTAEKSSEDQPYRTIFHEYVHLLLQNTMGSTIPVWFGEGLAEYYSTFDITEKNRKVILGDLIANHVLYLRDSKFLPLRTLFAVDHKSPYYNEGNKMNIFYAESWMLTHYLLQGEKQKRRPQLAQFVNLLRTGTAVETAFRQAFQLDIDTFEKSFKSYIQGGTYMATAVTFEKELTFDSEMQSAPLTEAEAKAYLGDLLQHIGRMADAETHLQQALTLSPGLPMAETSLGMLRVRQGKLAEARQHLQKAAEANSENYLAHFYYAFALSGLSLEGSQVVHNFETGLAEKMRAELKKAITLKPDFPESYALLGFVNIVRNEQLDETIDLLKRALTMSRSNQRIVFMLAQLYLRKENFAGSRELLEPIAQNSPDPELRKQARLLLEDVNRSEEEIARFKARQKAAEAAGLGPGLEFVVDTKTTDWNVIISESLRKPQTGELRLQGLLTSIECNARGITFHIKTGERTIKVHRANFEGITMATFTKEVAGDITCGRRSPENAVVVTYVTAKESRGVDGEIVALEFVPKDFVLKP